MKVKCITKYQDVEKKRLVDVGEEFEVSDARAKVLISAKVATAATTPEVVTKAAPKKATRKKAEA